MVVTVIQNGRTALLILLHSQAQTDMSTSPTLHLSSRLVMLLAFFNPVKQGDVSTCSIIEATCTID